MDCKMDTEKTEVVAEETAAPATTERTEAAPQQRYNRQNRNNRRKKVCLFCAENIDYIDYKDTVRLRKCIAPEEFPAPALSTRDSSLLLSSAHATLLSFLTSLTKL